VCVPVPAPPGVMFYVSQAYIVPHRILIHSSSNSNGRNVTVIACTSLGRFSKRMVPFKAFQLYLPFRFQHSCLALR